MSVQQAIRFLKQDRKLAKIINLIGDFEIKKRNNHFTALVEAIISQQLASGTADAITRRFRKLYPRFPKPIQILNTKDSKLRSVGLSKMKVKYLKDLARKIECGDLNLKTLSKLTDEEIIAQLTQVKGIGRWTTEMFLIFSCGRLDVLPVDDLGLRKGVQLAFSLPQLPKPKEVEEIGMRWKPYRSIATWYLWKSLQKFDRIG
jgi:DNA-3-methyladenine glycosylase II